MTRCLPLFPILVAAAAFAQPALAQSGPPPLKPAQDVAVTRRTPAGLPGLEAVETRELHAAASGRARFENGDATMIFDKRGRRAWMWQAAATGDARVVSEIRIDDEDLEAGLEELANDPDFEVKRLGSDRVAGLACTNWSVREKDDPPADKSVLCVAADGFTLRETTTQGGETNGSEAVKVVYGRLDPALFEPPAGWRVEPMSAGGLKLR